MGYHDSFSRLHSLAYSFVGIQSMTMATKFPRVYWNTAVLAVESGSAEDASGGVDYDKVAKAMGVIKRAGVQVRLPDINSSSAKFQPVAEENVILFGLKATRNISDDFVEKIVENRPYLSVEDFLVKVAPTKTQMIALIKSGSFDALGDRIEIMKTYLAITAKLKNKITLQNLDALMTLDLIPEDLFAMEKRIIRFNKQLRAHQKTGSGTNVKYLLTGPFQMFYEQFLNTDLVEAEGGSLFIQHKVWDKYYKQLIAPVALFIKNNSQMLLEKLNGSLLSEEWEKYAKGSIGHWEITQLGFIDAGHELFDAQVDTYGISHFDELPVIPALDQSFTTKTGKEIKLFKIDKISGVVCGKDKMKGLFYLLTDTGVVECKMSKEQFAEYDRQISEIQADGTKRIVAKSTFSVGNMLVVQGYRRDDMFAVKKYARTVGHSIYVIDEIVDGELIFSASRFD